MRQTGNQLVGMRDATLIQQRQIEPAAKVMEVFAVLRPAKAAHTDHQHKVRFAQCSPIARRGWVGTPSWAMLRRSQVQLGLQPLRCLRTKVAADDQDVEASDGSTDETLQFAWFHDALSLQDGSVAGPSEGINGEDSVRTAMVLFYSASLRLAPLRVDNCARFTSFM